MLMFSLASHAPPPVDLGMNIMLSGMEQGVDTPPGEVLDESYMDKKHMDE